jgi:RsiW-degrading membrane proteinase PrsW (M82 family)
MPSIMFNRVAWQRSFVPLSSNINQEMGMANGDNDTSSAAVATTEVASPSLVNVYTIQKFGDSSFEWERRPSLRIELIVLLIALSFVIYTLCHKNENHDRLIVAGIVSMGCMCGIIVVLVLISLHAETIPIASSLVF